jgi:hypothetical protein
VSRDARLNAFSILFGVIYMGFFFINEFHQFSLFGYYPFLGRFSRERLPLAEAGPAIFWYAWLVSAFIVSAALTLLVPVRLAERLGQGWVWAVPLALLIGTLVYERRWFY